MTREELQTLIEDSEIEIGEKLTQILNAFNAERNTEKLKTENVQKQLAEANQTIKDLQKANGDNAELQKRIEELNASQTALKAEYDALKLDSAITLALTESGARNVKIASLALDRDDLKLSKDGEILGLTEQIEKLKNDTETSFLFESEEKVEAVAEVIEPAKPARQSYEPTKGSDPKPKTQGAELGDRILAEKNRQSELLNQSQKGTN